MPSNISRSVYYLSVLAIWAASLACVAHLRAGEKIEPASPERSRYKSVFSASVDKIVHQNMLNQKIPSAVVAVAHDGVLLHTGAYGLSHVKPDFVTAAKTAYLIDSMTKQFTAAAIMLLVQDGRLDLDKPVKTYVPYAPAHWDRITLRHLLTHTSGLPHDPQWGYPSIKVQDSDPDRLLKHYVFNQKLGCAPGEEYAYSNTGYTALGAIIAKVSGKRYSQFLDERIFRPLNMTATVIDDSGGEVKGGARGYGFNDAKKEWYELNDATQPMAAGALQSTVLDLVKWDAALNGSGLLNESSKHQMWQPFQLTSGKSAEYGFGWVITTNKDSKVVWHNGGGWGFNTAIYRFLGSKLTVIVLTNLQVEDKGLDHASVLTRKIAEAYSPDLAMPGSSEEKQGYDKAGEKAEGKNKNRKHAAKRKSGK